MLINNCAYLIYYSWNCLKFYLPSIKLTIMKTATIILILLLSFSFGFTQNNSLTKTETLKDSTLVDAMPIYPGGEKALLKYISRNIEYPKTARKDKIQGKVYVSFIVNENGIVEDVKILKGIRDDINDAAIEVVEEMPEWTPGKRNGKNAKVQFTIPITFKLKK